MQDQQCLLAPEGPDVGRIAGVKRLSAPEGRDKTKHLTLNIKHYRCHMFNIQIERIFLIFARNLKIFH